jgi:sugar O-acyltransferase (sialic acid O-acetyltransferase NeuD family)
MSEKATLFLFGASGHAKVVVDIVERAGIGALGFIVDDDTARHGSRLLGYQVIGGREALLAQGARAGAALVAIGANPARRAIAAWLAAQGFQFASACHPSAQIGREVHIGGGTVAMAGAVVNSDTRIGMHCILNTACSVDHDCELGDGVHVAPGSRLCGGVKVGDGAFIGAGAVIVPGRRIGADAIIAAGAVVLKDVPERAVVAGNPGGIKQGNGSDNR